MKNKPRLLIVGTLPPPYSGYETATEVLMDSELDKLFKVKLFDARTTRNPSNRGKSSLSNYASTLIIVLQLIKTLVVFRPHIANVPLAQNRTGFLKWFALAVLCRMSGAKIVSRLGGQSFDKFYDASSVIQKYFIRFGLSIISVIIVRGVSLKSQFNGIVDLHKIEVVPNGFNIEKWHKGFSHLPESKKIRVLYLGQVSKAKGVLDLIEAAHILKENKKCEFYEFKVAGPILEKELNILHVNNPESTSKAIEKKISDLGLSDYIEFKGEVSWDEKRSLYEWSDVLVLPSYSEGFPYTVLEAFASGCAVICTNVGALPDYLKNEQEVLFVPIAQPKKISDALIEIKDSQKRKYLINSASKYLEENHGIHVFSKKMSAIFIGLVA